VIAVFEIDDNVNYIEMYIDDTCRLVETIVVRLYTIDDDDGGVFLIKVDIVPTRWAAQ